MLILVVAFPFIIRKEDFKKISKNSMLLLVFFIAFLLINSSIQGRLELDFVFIKTMMIPAGIVFLYLPIADFKKVNKAIVFSSFIAIIYTLVQFLILVNQNSDVSFLFFQETVDALLIDRVYVGLLCVLSILICYKSLIKEFHPDNKYYLTCIILNSAYLLLIMSKTALALLFFYCSFKTVLWEEQKN
jgi:hypothetical protein